MRRLALPSLLLIVLTLAAYWPVRQAEFNDFDDDLYVTDNPQVLHGLTREGFKWALTTFHASNWHPLTWLSHMTDCSAFGQKALGPHLVNVSVHTANACLLLLLLWQMTGAIWRSSFVAASFALHPLHVESVAWVAERKDVLSTFFGLLALLAYERYVQSSKFKVQSSRFTTVAEYPGTNETRATAEGASRFTFHVSHWYLASLLLFAFSLMSKAMLVTLPFVMLLLDFWPLRRVSNVRCQVSGAEHGVQSPTPINRERESNLHPPTPRLRRTRSPQRKVSSQVSVVSGLFLEKVPFFMLSAACSVVTFWAQKAGGAVLTLKNIPFPNRLANAVVSYATYVLKTFWPAKLAVPYPFVLELPTMTVALAAMGVLGVTLLCIKLVRRAPYAVTGWLWFVGTLIPVAGLVQVGTQAMADRYTYFPLIGVFVLVTWGVVELTAGWRYRKLCIPFLAAAMLGGCFLLTRSQLSYWRNSFELFSHTLQVTTNNPVAEQNLGYALALRGKEAEAARHFNAALSLWPDFPPALLNRGIARMLGGHVTEAIADYRHVIRLQPDCENAYFQLAGALAQQKKLAEAKTNYLLALRYRPDFAEAHTKLGRLMLLDADKTEAMSHLYEAVNIRPDYAEGQYALGNELAQQQKLSEAVVHLLAALKANPDYARALNDLAWILATENDPAIRNVPEAIRLASRACELTRNKEPRLLATLGVAYSEAGNFPEAIRVSEQALNLATAIGDEQTAAGLRRRLDFFRKGQGYRSIPK